MKLLFVNIFYSLLLLVSGCQGSDAIEGVNLQPEILGNPLAAAFIGEIYTFIPMASDPNEDELTFSISNMPAWASFDETTGTLSGIPDEGLAGQIYRGIGISVNDGEFTSTLEPFGISVLSKDRPELEIIIRTETNLHSPEDVSRLVNNAIETGVTAISVGTKNDEDYSNPSGLAYYKSSIAPVAPGYEDFDVLADLIPKAHQVGIKVRAWLPQFHDQVAFHKNDDWRMIKLENGVTTPVGGVGSNEYFVNPLHPGVQDYELSIIEEVVTNYDIDGIVLDWVRFDNYNMDLSGYTRAQYEKEFGYDPITIDFSTDNAQRQEWNDWRESGIATYIQRVDASLHKMKPEVTIGVYVLSPEWREVAQNPALFRDYIDYVCPMSYYDDWGYPYSWIYRDGGILSVTTSKVDGLPIMPVFDTDWDMSVFEVVFTQLDKKFPTVKSVSFFEYGEWNNDKFRSIRAISKDIGLPD